MCGRLRAPYIIDIASRTQLYDHLAARCKSEYGGRAPFFVSAGDRCAGDWNFWRLENLEIGISGDWNFWRLEFLEIGNSGDCKLLRLPTVLEIAISGRAGPGRAGRVRP